MYPTDMRSNHLCGRALDIPTSESTEAEGAHTHSLSYGPFVSTQIKLPFDKGTLSLVILVTLFIFIIMCILSLRGYCGSTAKKVVTYINNERKRLCCCLQMACPCMRRRTKRPSSEVPSRRGDVAVTKHMPYAPVANRERIDF
eukprot:GHVR01108111.1.p1 GENE.GHVR01108111.1~~GHVR01108111.1.p1  ORF type:complete len:143 (-),score=18.67 GHVR01108111.1:27-455(-)